MLKSERQALILKQIQLHNKVLSADLSSQLGVSEDTIRRDLNELALAKQVVKVHGGALAKAFQNDSVVEEDIYSLAEKRMIALKTRDLLRNGMLVLLGGGTTVREIVRHIPAELEITFFTLSLSTALELMHRPHGDVIFIGGKLDRDTRFSTGGETITKLADIRADLCILGTNAIDPKLGVTDSDFEVVQVKKAMRRAADKLAIVSISEKLGTAQKLRVCPLQEVDYLITELPAHHAALLPYQEVVQVV